MKEIYKKLIKAGLCSFIIFLILLLSGCGQRPVVPANTSQQQTEPKPTKPSEYYIDKLKKADELVVDEHKLSLGKNYDIVVDGEVVATVTGKFFKLGDTFTMKDPNGKTIMIAEEDYKWHALLDRNFTLKDP